MPDIIKNWGVLRNLNKTFLSTINLVYIFGTNGKQVIITTNDDNVYAFGDNDSNGCLGLGHTNPITEPTKIEELCGKQVIHFEFSMTYNFVMARTQSGSIYSWGYNGNGELGIGNYTAQPKIISALSNKNVIDIKICTRHALALTDCGDVYVWGQRVGNTPIKLKFESRNRKIVAISSGSHHVLALTDTHKVLYWGSNIHGQCGNGRKNDSYYATDWCELENAAQLKAAKIACGPNHSIILSTKGIVYCFGSNECGQCGNGTNIIKNIPTKVSREKYVGISATKHYNISVALSDNGYCYIWGECGQNRFNTPNKIPCNNMDEVLQFYSRNKVTIIPLIINDKDCKNRSIMDRIGNAFNRSECSDVAFKVKGRRIFAQRTHLINVSAHFKSMFAGNDCVESNKTEIVIENCSYTVYCAFIKYLYTDCIDLSTDEDAMQLMDLANRCSPVDEALKQRCVEIIKNSITIENVFAIYCSADKYKSIELKAYCEEYLKNNIANKTKIEAFIENAFKLIGE